MNHPSASATTPKGCTPKLQLWGGVECSVVRVANKWRDQVRETGHHDRSGDLDQIAAVGIRSLRYPILWERVASNHPGSCGWAWHDTRLNAINDRGIGLIAGLLHHGSGPAATQLLDPDFPEKLADHAGEAARRYPFVGSWNVINEPLTTARFSCLYGFWYPHKSEESSFLRAVVNQCRAILLAIRSIRAHNPTAILVQTEDLGRIFSTDPLRQQAAYENERRWLAFDLLCGRVDRTHPWRSLLEETGVPTRHLDELATGEATPGLLGINHYVSSDRFLDHRVHLYPPHLHGGNGRMSYADTEAARVECEATGCEWEARLREAWERYDLPLAVTEVHLGCENDHEQLRWLMQAWRAASTLEAEGADVRAVTAWALFGLVDWDSVLREYRGRYEAGVFDARYDPPRPTILAEALRSLATTGSYDHAALFEPGWWQREDRFHARLRPA
jgi:beta-glucosidase/6-phospho-beta-glucosidase/beta-galactosidase